MECTHWLTIKNPDTTRVLVETEVDLTSYGMADLVIGYLYDGADIRLTATGSLRFPWGHRE